MKIFISILFIFSISISVNFSILLANDEENLEEYKEMMELLEKQNEQNLKVMESLIKPGGMLDKNESLLEFLKNLENERDDKINHQVKNLDEKIIETVELIENNSLLKARINAMMINWRKLGIPEDQELKSHYENIRKELIESINIAKNK